MTDFLTRDEIAAERVALELTVAETYKALRDSPAFKAYDAAEFRLIEHRCLYGDPTSAGPCGLLNSADDPDACVLCDVALDDANRAPDYPHLCRACNADVEADGPYALPGEDTDDTDHDFTDLVP